MKKFGKFLFGTLSLAAVVGGAFYFFKNVVNKDKSDDFEDFEDDFEDDDELEESPAKENTTSDSREYVTLHITPESDNTEEPISEEAKEEPAGEEKPE